jgi:plasmid stabilization system protein ParE
MTKKPLVVPLALAFALSVLAAAPQDESWAQAEKNAVASQRAVRFSRRFAQGWLVHADPRSGLIPRNLTVDAFWNAKDAAADNYPFIVLTAHILDDMHLKQTVAEILAAERKLTPRLDSLPDDFLFSTQAFRMEKPDLAGIVFGAAEYAKDGLMPVTEWLGPSPWLGRMEEIVRDVFKHAAIETPSGPVPSLDVEVVGDLLQASCRLAWATGDEDYRAWAYRLADLYLVHRDLLAGDSLRLRDHGSEIIGGLSEACVLASREDPERWKRYRPRMRAVLDRVLEKGTNPDGLLYNAFNPQTGEVLDKGLADTWGYVYNAFLAIAAIDNEPRYREAAARALGAIAKYEGYDWENGSADGYADSIESAINLLARIPSDAASGWADKSMEFLFGKQRPDGILEGWHGDGNSARTALMWALAKTQGVAASPWRDDLKLGAVRLPDGGIQVVLTGDWPWSGTLRFDRPRHRVRTYLPFDYPRINQFPEWFTADATGDYEITIGEGPARIVKGHDLYELTLKVKAGETLRLTVKSYQDPAAPKLRTLKYTPRSPRQTVAWQKDLRSRLFQRLAMSDQIGAKVPLDARVLSSEERDGYVFEEVELNSTPGRKIKAVVTVPRTGQAPYPAVVAIHGHGGSRFIVHDRTSVYKGFAAELAGTGYVTIAVDVGQHVVDEPGRLLNGERLRDLMRAVDYLTAMEEVDRARIGCAGLSLGGEMAMWLAAMDERVAACVSSGFLTTMDQMEYDHCMCWKFDGLRELADFADIFGMIAPRPLQCQNGLREAPAMFVVPLARQAMDEIRPVYAALGRPGNVGLAIHRGEHEIDLASLVEFFRTRLAKAAPTK